MRLERRRATTFTAIIAWLLAVSLGTPTSAWADATATVMARTQRMSEPNLNSAQNGWYEKGQQLTLVCSTREQAVKGYFSFNIPNGGWDNLWYKTSDGSFVADVDIETRTLDAVAPDCNTPPPPPPPQQSAGLRAPLDGNPAPSRGFGGNGHNGIDYPVGVGTPVYAADGGTVAFEGHGEAHGWMTWMAGICVLLKHGDKYTGYAHLSRTVINNGQQVSKGQLIGYSGSTGNSSGPHLHFETLPLNPNFQNGYSGRMDPAPFMG